MFPSVVDLEPEVVLKTSTPISSQFAVTDALRMLKKAKNSAVLKMNFESR
jgi:hypothetical protein